MDKNPINSHEQERYINPKTELPDYSHIDDVFEQAVFKSRHKKLITYASGKTQSAAYQKKHLQETYREKPIIEPVSPDDIQTDLVTIKTEAEELQEIESGILEKDRSDSAENNDYKEREQKMVESFFSNLSVLKAPEPAAQRYVPPKSFDLGLIDEKPVDLPDEGFLNEQATKVLPVLSPETQDDPYNALFQDEDELDADAFDTDTFDTDAFDTAPIDTEQASEQPQKHASIQAEAFASEGDASEKANQKNVLQAAILHDEHLRDAVLNQAEADAFRIEEAPTEEQFCEEAQEEVVTPLSGAEQTAVLPNLTDAQTAAVSNDESAYTPESEALETVLIHAIDRDDRLSFAETSNDAALNAPAASAQGDRAQQSSAPAAAPDSALEKDYKHSAIGFGVSIAALAAFILFSYKSFLPYDYITLAMLAVGMIIAPSMRYRNITIMCGAILMAVIFCMIWTAYQSADTIAFFHYLWFLLIPICVSASYAFFSNRACMRAVQKKQADKEKSGATEPTDFVMADRIESALAENPDAAVHTMKLGHRPPADQSTNNAADAITDTDALAISDTDDLAAADNIDTAFADKPDTHHSDIDEPDVAAANNVPASDTDTYKPDIHHSDADEPDVAAAAYTASATAYEPTLTDTDEALAAADNTAEASANDLGTVVFDNITVPLSAENTQSAKDGKPLYDGDTVLLPNLEHVEAMAQNPSVTPDTNAPATREDGTPLYDGDTTFIPNLEEVLAASPNKTENADEDSAEPVCFYHMSEGGTLTQLPMNVGTEHVGPNCSIIGIAESIDNADDDDLDELIRELSFMRQEMSQNDDD